MCEAAPPSSKESPFDAGFRLAFVAHADHWLCADANRLIRQRSAKPPTGEQGSTATLRPGRYCILLDSADAKLRRGSYATGMARLYQLSPIVPRQPGRLIGLQALRAH
jgi:hypothetical protein